MRRSVHGLIMPPIRFQVNNNPENRRRQIQANGGQPIEATSQIQQDYAVSTVAHTPITKAAQFTGSGANAVFTQPMFFSPLHTPQNWQIPSKRREAAQWLILANTGLTLNDYTTKCVQDLLFDFDKAVVDPATNGTWYQDIKSEPVLGASGKLRRPPHFSERDCEDKRCFSFNAYGYWRSIEVSEEHKMFVIDGKTYRHKKKCEQNAAHRRKKGIKEGGDKPPIKFPDKLICKKEAQDIVKDDFLITPMPELGQVALDKNQAWLVGLCIADGCLSKEIYHSYSVQFTMDKDEYHVPEFQKCLAESWNGSVADFKHGDGDGWRVRQSGKDSWAFFESYITGKRSKKKFTADAFELDQESRLHILGGYFDGDGSFNPAKNHLEATNYSCDMADQLYWMLLSVGISCSLRKCPLYGNHYKTNPTHCYRISIPSSEVPKLQPYMRSNKIPEFFESKKDRQLRFFYTEDGITYLAQPISEIKEFSYTGKGYDLQIDPERAFVASGFVTSNCRFYYDTEPKVAAAVDFYANFSMSGFKLECKDKKILRYYEQLVEDLDLEEWLAYISHEYFMLGDVFPFLEIRCESCQGSGYTPDGEECFHPDGKFGRIVLMNPDYIEVQQNVLAEDSVIALTADEELRMLVQRREPRQLFDKLDPRLIDLVASGKPIPLSSRSISHLRHNASSYATYGTSMLRRLFTMLAYKTKIITANWIVAERMILPIRIVKVGDKDRPASDEDLSNVQSQLAAVANDPNLTIVTHHAFEYSWEGATSKIHNISSELENIGKEILDGMMINQALLNGEASSYSSSQVGVEVLIKRLQQWQNKLSKWVEKRIFRPMAMMQGFIDEEATKELDEDRYIYMFPTVKWNDLNLRDKSNMLQLFLQLYDKQLMSGQTLLEEFDLDFDQEQERLREEQQLAMASGQLMPGGGENLGTMGMGGMLGGMMGGPPGAEGMPGGMPGDMGGAPGMGAPGMGAPGMGDPGMGGAPAGPATASGMVVTKKGKGAKPEEPRTPQTKIIRLTKLEQQMFKALSTMKVPFALFGQYQVRIPGQQQPFLLDFAYPEIGVGVEAEGSIWHERADLKIRDLERDQKLANVGWRILRFKEDAIENNVDLVKDIIMKHVVDASENLKKAAESEEEFNKFASMTRFPNQLETGALVRRIEDIENDLGIMIMFGEPQL